MDRGRIIDNIQNTNARFIDNFGASNKTSVRTTNPPGGKSTFSLGWTEPEVPVNKNRNNNYNAPSNNNYNAPSNNNYNAPSNNNYNNYNDNYPMNNNNNMNYNMNNNYDANQVNTQKTGVRVKYAPGGTSNIIFGTDSTNYDDYRKNPRK